MRKNACYTIYFCCVLLGICFVSACGVPAPPKTPLTGSLTPLSTVTASATTPAHMLGLTIQVRGEQSHLIGYPGSLLSLTIATGPYALCNFSVAYGKSVPSRAVGIEPGTANGQGIMSWTWRIDGDAYTGTWPLSITATLPNGSRATTSTSTVVTLPPISVVPSQSTLTAAPHATMTLTIITAPAADCTLALNYGPTKPIKYLTVRTNFNGQASWTWRVDNQASAGSWPLLITETLASGQTTTARVMMTIV